jgi:amino acid permease
MAVKWYGETEFWAALGKMLLIIGLIIYTFVAMLGKFCLQSSRQAYTDPHSRREPLR